MKDPLSVSFEDAAENHRIDALRMTHAERWRWLLDAMDFGFEVARSRARRGLKTTDAYGRVIEVAPDEG
jgi:hypothetical protein